MFYRYLFPIVLVSIGGCAPVTVKHVATPPARDGAVGMSEITDEIKQSNRLVMAENETFIPPLENEGNKTPAYPQGLLGENVPPRNVCVQVAIDEKGNVMRVAPIAQPPKCADAQSIEPQILEEIEQTLSAWRFEPGLRCVFPDLKTKETTYGSCGDAKAIPEAVSLVYRFVFEQKDGSGVVTVGQGF
ncbi:hypothetical protein [[Pseudomonas] boreopolis]